MCSHGTVARLPRAQGHQRTPRRHRNGHHQPLHPGGPQQAPGGRPPARTHALRLGQAPAADPGGHQPAAEAPGALRRGAGGGRQEDLRPPRHPVRLQPVLQVRGGGGETSPDVRPGGGPPPSTGCDALHVSLQGDVHRGAGGEPADGSGHPRHRRASHGAAHRLRLHLAGNGRKSVFIYFPPEDSAPCCLQSRKTPRAI